MAVGLLYTPVGWVSGSAPKINGSNLSQMDGAIQQAGHITGLESDRTPALATAHPGIFMFCTDSGMLYLSLGSGTWQRAPTGDPNWTTPALGGTWATSAAAQTAGEDLVRYRKDAAGFIRMVGYIDTGFSAATPILTFPVGDRPLKTRRFMAPTGGTVSGDAASSKAAFVFVKADGTLNWNGEGSTFITLDNVNFLAEQ